MTEIRVLADPPAVGRAAADFLLDTVDRCPPDRRCNVALSGGGTPRLMYRALAARPGVGPRLNTRARFFFSDERPVGPDHPDSNYRLAHDHLFAPLHIDETNVHRMKGEAPDLSAEAERYAALVRSLVPAGPSGIPSFDLVFLGMGADGHTASLFPDLDLDIPPDALVIAPYVPSLGSHRLSFTVRLIDAAAVVLFLVTGRAKAETLAGVLSRRPGGRILPAGQVQAERVIWMVDREAADRLDPGDPRITMV